MVPVQSGRRFGACGGGTSLFDASFFGAGLLGSRGLLASAPVAADASATLRGRDVRRFRLRLLFCGASGFNSAGGALTAAASAFVGAAAPPPRHRGLRRQYLFQLYRLP